MDFEDSTGLVGVANEAVELQDRRAKRRCGVSQIAERVRAAEATLGVAQGGPSKDTDRRVLQRLRPEAFQRCFETWLPSLMGTHDVRFLAIDSQTLRRSHDGTHGLGALHLVSVWATEKYLSLQHTAVDDRICEAIYGMQCLEVPLLRSTDITDAELEHLRTLAGLKILALDGTKITDAGAPKLKGLYNHRSINLSGTRMTEEGVRQFSEYPLLKFIPAMVE